MEFEKILKCWTAPFSFAAPSNTPSLLDTLKQKNLWELLNSFEVEWPVRIRGRQGNRLDVCSGHFRFEEEAKFWGEWRAQLMVGPEVDSNKQTRLAMRVFRRVRLKFR